MAAWASEGPVVAATTNWNDLEWRCLTVFPSANPTVLLGSGRPTGFMAGIAHKTTETGLPLLVP